MDRSIFLKEALSGLNATVQEMSVAIKQLTKSYETAISNFLNEKHAKASNVEEKLNNGHIPYDYLNFASDGLRNYLDSRGKFEFYSNELLNKDTLENVELLKEGWKITDLIISRGVLDKVLNISKTSATEKEMDADVKIVEIVSGDTSNYPIGLQPVTEHKESEGYYGILDLFNELVPMDDEITHNVAQFISMVKQYYLAFTVLPNYEKDLSLMLFSVVGNNRSMSLYAFTNTIHGGDAPNSLDVYIDEIVKSAKDSYSETLFWDEIKNNGKTYVKVGDILSLSVLVEGAGRYSKLVALGRTQEDLEREADAKEKNAMGCVEVVIEKQNEGEQIMNKTNFGINSLFKNNNTDREVVENNELAELERQIAILNKKRDLLRKEDSYKKVIEEIKLQDEVLIEAMKVDIEKAKEDLKKIEEDYLKEKENQDKNFLEKAWDNKAVRYTTYAAGIAGAIYVGKKLYDHFTEDSNDVIIIDGEY